MSTIPPTKQYCDRILDTRRQITFTIIHTQCINRCLNPRPRSPFQVNWRTTMQAACSESARRERPVCHAITWTPSSPWTATTQRQRWLAPAAKTSACRLDCTAVRYSELPPCWERLKNRDKGWGASRVAYTVHATCSVPSFLPYDLRGRLGL